MRARASVLIAVSVLAFATSARASDADDAFKDGIKLLDEGKIIPACAAFERSQRLEPAAGTLLNLAGCYEKAGRKGIAARTFKKARDAAKARGRADWETTASEHLRALDGQSPVLTFKIRETGPVEITIDGEIVTRADLDAPYPIDPGKHAIEAREKDRKPFAEKLDVTQSTEVTIPILETTTALASTSGASPISTRTLGIIVGATGVAVIGFGAIGGVIAGGALDDARASCPSYPDHCTSAANDPNDRAHTWSTISTVSFIAGGVLAAGGAVLFFWPAAPKSNVALGITPEGHALVRGSF